MFSNFDPTPSLILPGISDLQQSLRDLARARQQLATQELGLHKVMSQLYPEILHLEDPDTQFVAGQQMSLTVRIPVTSQIRQPAGDNDSATLTREHDFALTNSDDYKEIELYFSWIPAGQFQMGGEWLDQRPVRTVRHTKGFWIGTFLITQQVYTAVMHENPSQFKGYRLPVERVTWFEAKEFSNRLSEYSGKRMRLPTEAEWEYSARAGHDGIFSDSEIYNLLPHYCWSSSNSLHRTQPVGLLKPNAWGLYDILGNVNEWCEDGYVENAYSTAGNVNPITVASQFQERVIRGGSWEDEPIGCTPYARYFRPPNSCDSDIGFRIVFTPE